MIRVLTEVYESLERTAKQRGLGMEDTFVHVLKNAVRVYPTLEAGGSVRIFKEGVTSEVHIVSEKRSSLWVWILSWFTPRQSSQPLGSRLFEAEVEDELLSTIAEHAEFFGFTRVDMVNRMITTGCEIEANLPPERKATLHDSEGVLLEIVAFQ